MTHSATLKYLRWWRAGGYALILLVIYLSLTRRPPDLDIDNGDKLGHFLAYGSLMFWFAQLALERLPRLRWALAFVAMGITLEFVQGMTSYRSFDVIDMLANSVGVGLGWLLALPWRVPLFLRIETLLARPR